MATGVGAQAATIVSGILFARTLGPEGRGIFALLSLFPFLLSQLGGMGVPHALTYYAARDGADPIRLMQKLWPTFAIQMGALLAVHYFVVSAFVSGKSPEVVGAGYVTLALVPALLAQQYGLAMLQGLRVFKTFNIVRLLPIAVLPVILIILLLIGRTSFFDIALSWTMITLCAGVATLIIALRFSVKARSNEDGVDVRTMVRFGLKGLVGATSPLEYLRLDQLAAGFLLSPTALGYYVVAQSFMNLPRLISQSIGIIAFPEIARSRDLNVGAVWRFFSAGSIINGIVVAGLVLLVPILIPLFFGTQFQDSAPVAQILLAGAWFMAGRRILGEGCRGLGFPQISTVAELAMYPWLFLMGVVLVGAYTLSSLALIVATAYGISLVVALVLTSRLRTRTSNRARTLAS